MDAILFNDGLRGVFISSSLIPPITFLIADG